MQPTSTQQDVRKAIWATKLEPISVNTQVKQRFWNLIVPIAWACTKKAKLSLIYYKSGKTFPWQNGSFQIIIGQSSPINKDCSFNNNYDNSGLVTLQNFHVMQKKPWDTREYNPLNSTSRLTSLQLLLLCDSGSHVGLSYAKEDNWSGQLSQPT